MTATRLMFDLIVAILSPGADGRCNAILCCCCIPVCHSLPCLMRFRSAQSVVSALLFTTCSCAGAELSCVASCHGTPCTVMCGMSSAALRTWHALSICHLVWCFVHVCDWMRPHSSSHRLDGSTRSHPVDLVQHIL